jgi:hypothetical protein
MRLELDVVACWRALAARLVRRQVPSSGAREQCRQVQRRCQDNHHDTLKAVATSVSPIPYAEEVKELGSKGTWVFEERREKRLASF